MRVATALLVVMLLAGCDEDSLLGRPADAGENLRRAERVVRLYLDAAAADDGRRLCALRTVRDQRQLGGPEECRRRLARSAFDGGREPPAVERGRVKILPADTHYDPRYIVVWADAGEAYFEDGHATGGTVVEAEVYEKDGRYRIGGVGEAVFAD